MVEIGITEIVAVFSAVGTGAALTYQAGKLVKRLEELEKRFLRVEGNVDTLNRKAAFFEGVEEAKGSGQKNKKGASDKQ